jgi:hypothetical protein
MISLLLPAIFAVFYTASSDTDFNITDEHHADRALPILSSAHFGQRTQEVLDHAVWDELLKKYVDDSGGVNYAALKKERNQLKGYLSYLGQHVPDPSAVSEEERLAYWINVYNAFTVELILEHYPLKSIRDIGDGNPWDAKWIDLGGKKYSLNQIEHEIIRPRFGEPRIHFAVNCAAKSCPPLLNTAWTGENLSANLQEVTEAFINNSSYNKISRSRLSLSRIFDWYEEDFESIAGFVSKYAHIAVNSNAKISYLEYDWALNRQ